MGKRPTEKFSKVGDTTSWPLIIAGFNPAVLEMCSVSLDKQLHPLAPRGLI